MQLEHSFTVPVGVDEAFRILRDVERIAPCMPGATIDEVTDDSFTGKVKVKVGPITVTYRGRAQFVDVDEQTHTASIKASGTEMRGSGTANATVTARLTGAGESTDVVMTTDLAITGKPAQFGRGVMADVGNKLVTRFADCLSEQLSAPEPGMVEAPEVPAGEPGAAQPAPAPPSPRQAPQPEAIDLFEVAGAPLAKRLVPVASAVAVLLLFITRFLRRRR